MDVFLEIYMLCTFSETIPPIFLKKFLLGVDCQGEPIGGEATGEIAKDSTVKNKVNHT